MGSGTDAAKTVSCLTLFEAAGLETPCALLVRLGLARSARSLKE